MRTITSADNPLFKKIGKLLNSRSERQEQKLFVIEGYRSFQFAKDVKTVFVAEGKPAPDGVSEQNVFELPVPLFNKIALTENNQGVLGVCGMPAPGVFDQRKNYFLLDGIQDPGNLGTIIRTAAGLDFGGVILGPGCVDVFNPKVVRSTMGAIFTLPILDLESVDLSKAYCIGTELSGKNLSSFQPKQNFILVIGSEGHGMSPELKQKCTDFVKIELGPGIESYNAAISAGILGYTIKNKLK